MNFEFVIPAKAEIHWALAKSNDKKFEFVIPAEAGIHLVLAERRSGSPLSRG
jgi:hypothetical protein